MAGGVVPRHACQRSRRIGRHGREHRHRVGEIDHAVLRVDGHAVERRAGHRLGGKGVGDRQPAVDHRASPAPRSSAPCFRACRFLPFGASPAARLVAPRSIAQSGQRRGNRRRHDGYADSGGRGAVSAALRLRMETRRGGLARVADAMEAFAAGTGLAAGARVPGDAGGGGSPRPTSSNTRTPTTRATRPESRSFRTRTRSSSRLSTTAGRSTR